LRQGLWQERSGEAAVSGIDEEHHEDGGHVEAALAEQTRTAGEVPGEDEVALLHGMLDIESPSGEERPLSEYLCAQMAARGFRAHVDPVGNAVGEIGNDGPLLVLLGHMDTAPGHVPVRFDNGLLFGRGAVDAKGPLAAFICAAARLRVLTDMRIVVVGAVEEESASSCGARHVAAWLRPALCVIGEPSRWDRVTLGYKGRLLVEFAIQQGSAHTAGVLPTASQQAAEFWSGVRALTEEYGGAREFERLSPTLRRIHGESDGLQDRASLSLSLRLPPVCDTRALRERIRALAGHGEVHFFGDEPAYRAPKNTPLVRAFLSAIRSHGGSPAFALKTGTSDMNVVAPIWACPILAYGPGDSALDHTPDERVSILEYGRAIAVLEDALRRLTPAG